MPFTPKAFLVLNKRLVSEEGAIQQPEEAQAPAAGGLALWARHWSSPKPRLHLLSSNTGVAAFTLP